MMGEIIYWKQYDEPKKYFDKFLNTEREIPGEYVCNDERVENFAFVGGLSAIPGKEMSLMAMFLFKDGSRHEIKIIPSVDTEDDIKQAEDFLKSIKHNN